MNVTIRPWSLDYTQDEALMRASDFTVATSLVLSTAKLKWPHQTLQKKVRLYLALQGFNEKEDQLVNIIFWT